MMAERLGTYMLLEELVEFWHIDNKTEILALIKEARVRWGEATTGTGSFRMSSTVTTPRRRLICLWTNWKAPAFR
jgi:hypothetical protein